MLLFLFVFDTQYIQAFDYDLAAAIPVYMDVDHQPVDTTARRSSASSSVTQAMPEGSHRFSTSTIRPTSASTTTTFRSITCHQGEDDVPLLPNPQLMMHKRMEELVRGTMSSSSDLDTAFQTFMYGGTSSGGINFSDHFNNSGMVENTLRNYDNDRDDNQSNVRQDIYDDHGIRLPDPVQRQQLLGDDPLSFLDYRRGRHRSRTHGYDHGGDDDDDEMMAFARADDPSVDWLFPTPRHISYQRSLEEV